ncbi:MAG: putative quinol monooxygenase [Oliverpabstia sp.]
MIVVYAKCVVTGQNRKAFLELAGKLVEETRKEPGNKSYHLVQSRESQNIYAFVEEWPGKEELDIHMTSEHFKRLGAEIRKVVEGSLEITTHQLLL